MDDEPIQTPDPLAQARTLFLEDRRRRADACQQEINAVLERHRCTLSVSAQLTQERTTFQMNIVPLD